MIKEEIIQHIDKLRKEKNAIILAHYYQESDIQDIADFVGDSLALAQWLQKLPPILLYCVVFILWERLQKY